MQDARYKEIMQQLGMPDSQSLLLALRQVANETAKENKGITNETVLEVVDNCFHAYASNYRTEAREMAEDLLT